MTKAILFDFWGTLVENGVWSPIKQVKDLLGINLPFSEYVVRFEKAMMTRTFKDLREAFQKVCEEFQISPEEEKVEGAVGLWNKSWMLAQPYEEVAEVLSELRKKYQLILVSNTDCFSIPKVLDKFNFRDYFDRIYFSYGQGCIKTDRKFFWTVLRDLQLNVDECLMVGDSIQSDIMPTKSIGMRAVLIDRKNCRDFNPKIRDLREIKRLVEN